MLVAYTSHALREAARVLASRVKFGLVAKNHVSGMAK